MKVYLSSTFLDLEEHRETVRKALRKAQYDVVLMEEYVARDEFIEIACQGDVTGCQVYVGIFAWRYGYIPEDNNPERQSVTEMELCAAERESIPRLVFLVKEQADWPAQWRDPDQTRILDLRSRWQKRCAAYFQNASDLAMEVLAALRVLECTRRMRQLDAVRVIHEAQAFGPSYMVNIQDKLQALRDAPYIELQIGPAPWWNTRLHLIAALAEEYGRTEEFVFLDAGRRFLAMASPYALRTQLENRWPVLAATYDSFRLKFRMLSSVEENLWLYPQHVREYLGVEEESAHEVITSRHLEYDLAIPRQGEVVEIAGKNQSFLIREVLGRPTPFVILVREGQVEGLVDRTALADQIAAQALEDLH